MYEIIFIISFIAVVLAIGLYFSMFLFSSANKKNEILINEMNKLREITESLNKEIKFQSNVNKTLREGLDAITKKNCHVKNTDENK